MKPNISVIIPVYNTSKYLKKCLDSVINQTYKNIEIIIVNDGSTDNSQSIIDEYKKKDNRIISIKDTNHGQGHARNIGIEKATGKFITFIDSDDYVDINMLSEMYQEAIKNNADIVSTTSMIEKYDKFLQEKKDILSDDAKKNYLLTQSGPCSKLIKTKIIKENQLFFPKLKAYEDIAIVPIWGLFSNKIVEIDKSYYYYYIHEGSTMKQTIYNKKLEEIFKSMESLYLQLNNKLFLEKYYEELEWIYIKHLLHAASLRFIKFDNYKTNINKIVKEMKVKFPNWEKNKYYKRTNIKYKIICNLLYKKNYCLLKLILR